jgi:hypothetical protein
LKSLALHGIWHFWDVWFRLFTFRGYPGYLVQHILIAFAFGIINILYLLCQPSSAKSDASVPDEKPTSCECIFASPEEDDLGLSDPSLEPVQAVSFARHP